MLRTRAGTTLLALLTVLLPLSGLPLTPGTSADAKRSGAPQFAVQPVALGLEPSPRLLPLTYNPRHPTPLPASVQGRGALFALRNELAPRRLWQAEPRPRPRLLLLRRLLLDGG
ncbi:MAG: hypothetical protein U5L04_11125 [Trueperaceae bacterium]|nr:hypothetical protein [Trueperaceae bacterium]